ncbi:MAG: NADH-ubiquinone oxidoreductase-F iron-sulfur binding region domain-containing protein [Nitriliruptorales bacterium]|nr:NADH-ubiquinone oxidoreductase-F iron-sulfur binding region domain-containing protein [Nitriliruptorales bacterium]
MTDRRFSVAEHDRLLPAQPIATLDDWLEGDGGLGYATALDLDRDDVIGMVERSGLRGRGGAGFPTGRKWRGVLEVAEDSESPVFLVANAAEGEPGTYKDRTIIEYNPYAFLEGMLIAMYAVGAQRAFIGIKEKFTGPVERLAQAMEEMIAAEWRGADQIELVPGPDEYLFGEEKAMLEVIEGKLPMPRIIPPYQAGLFATTQHPNPTVVNNVETFSHIPGIVAHGPDWFREVGTEDSPGTMVFTVVGDVDNEGVYELPLGTPLETLLVDIAGARDIKAIYSGTSNTVITPDQLEVPLTFDAMSEAGTGLGSGGFIVYDSSHCIVKVLAKLSRFLAIESCGQCNACVLGTEEITDLLEKVDAGDGTQTDLDAIAKRVTTVTDQNRCYLPVGEQLMVGSTLDRFADEFTAHLGEPCPSDREVPTPLIEHIDEDSGEVTYHPRYHKKQPDWSYEDEDPREQRMRAITQE